MNRAAEKGAQEEGGRRATGEEKGLPAGATQQQVAAPVSVLRLPSPRLNAQRFTGAPLIWARTTGLLAALAPLPAVC